MLIQWRVPFRATGCLFEEIQYLRLMIIIGSVSYSNHYIFN